MFNSNVAATIAALVLVCSLHPSLQLIDGSDSNKVADGSVKDNHIHKDEQRTGRSLHKECTSGSLNAKCLKIHVLSLLEELSSRDELPLLSGLSIVKENLTAANPSLEEMAAELSRQFPGKPDEKLNRFLLYRLQNYLDGHSLRYRLLDPQTTKEAMTMVKGDKETITSARGGGGGGLGGGGKGGGGLLAAALMMKGKLSYRVPVISFLGFFKAVRCIFL